MKLSTRMGIFLIAFMLSVSYSFAQVSDLYLFSQIAGTYTPVNTADPAYVSLITDGWDDDEFSAIDIGFNFIYDGVTYTQFGVDCNGWIQMGNNDISNSYYPLSNLANTISILGGDLTGNVGSTLGHIVTGAAPFRVLTVQWSNVKRYGTTAAYDFQIKLYETTNVVELVYGTMTNTTVSSNYAAQVGITGSTTADFNNRMTDPTNNWTNTISGTANSSTCQINGTTIMPTSGLTFRYTRVTDAIMGTNVSTSGAVIGGSYPINKTTVFAMNVGVAPPFDVTRLKFNAVGTTNFADISGARLYYTPTGTFSTETQFGGLVTDVSVPFQFTGTQSCTGNGYFWLVFDVAFNATIGNTITATLDSATVAGVNMGTGSLNAPGTRTIVSPVATSIVSATDLLSSTTNAGILKIAVDNQTTINPINATQFVFNTNSQTTAATTLGSDVTAVRVFYSAGINAFDPATNILFGSGTITPDGIVTITGTQALAAGMNYFWLSYQVPNTAVRGDSAFAMLVNATVNGSVLTSVAPNAQSARRIMAPLQGDVLIGPSQTGMNAFPTLSDAFAYINLYGLAGNTNLIIAENVTEPATVTALNQIVETGVGGYTLKIYPSAPNLTITNPTTRANVISINGADRVTIDGRLNGTGANSLTIRNQSPTSPSYGIYVSGTNTNDLTIRNLTIYNDNNWFSTDTTFANWNNRTYCIYGTGAAHNNLQILNNRLKGASYAIYYSQGSGTSICQNAVISDNIIGGSNPADYLTINGVYLYYFNNLLFTKNEIFNVQSPFNSTNGIAGLYTDYLTASTISKNKVYTVYQNNGLYTTSTTAHYGAWGIYVGSYSTNNTIASNAIWDIHTANNNGTTSMTSTYLPNNPLGIYIKGYSGSSAPTVNKVWFNSVHLYGSQLPSRRPTANRGTTSACLFYYYYSNIDQRNNSLKNSMMTEINRYMHYCVISQTSSGITYSKLDNNNYWLNDNTIGTNYFVAYFNGANRATIANWRSVFSANAADAQDTYAQFADPVYTSNANLEPIGASSLGYMAQNIAQVTDDINSQARGLYPTIGAYNYAGNERVYPPTLTAPANNVLCQVQLPTFSWQTVTGAASYTLQYSTSSVFSDFVEATGITTTSYSLLAGAELIPNTKYYWRVKTHPSVGTLVSGWSTTYNFTVQGTASAPTLAFPVNNTNIDKNDVFTWSAMPNAASYHIQISTISDFSTILHETDVATNSYLWADATPYIDIFWRVKSNVACDPAAPYSTTNANYIATVTTLSESFDVDYGTDASGYFNLPPNWTKVTHTSNTPATNGYWRRVTAGQYPVIAPHTGAGMVQAYNYSNPGGSTNPQPIQLLCTPQIALNPGDVITFWMYRSSSYNYVSGCNFYFNNALNLTGATNLGFIFTSYQKAPIVAAAGWYQYQVTVPAGLAYNSGYFIMENISDNYQSVQIDDVNKKATWSAPLLNTPLANGVNVDTLGTVFTWHPTENATSYQFQLSTDPTFATIVDEATTTDTTHVLGIAQLQAVSQYYWRVIARNGIQHTPWSQVRNFISQGEILAPELISPYDNLTRVFENKAYLTWTAPRGATKYTIYVSTDPTFATINDSISNYTSTTWKASPDLAQNTLYYWKVQAANSAVSSPWSVVWAFRTRVPGNSPFADVQLGTGTATSKGIENPTWEGSRIQYLITAAELNAVGIAGPATLNQIQFNVVSIGLPITTDFVFRIEMKNTTLTTLALPVDYDGYTLVYNTPVPVNTTGWNIYNFTTPFEWDGTSNIIVSFCKHYSPWGDSPDYTVEGSTISGYNPMRSNYDDQELCSAPGDYTTTSTFRPNFKFSGIAIGAGPSDMHYMASDVAQASSENTFQGAANQVVLAYKVWMDGTLNPVNATNYVFNSVGTTNLSDITNAKLWYTGLDNTFTLENRTQVGTTIATPGEALVFTGNVPLQGTMDYPGTSLADAKWNYFWLTYDIPPTATMNNYVDAQGLSMTIDGEAELPLHTNPEGNRKIDYSLGGEYTVGNTPTANYQNFTAAFDDINSHAVRADITLKVIADVNQPAPAMLNPLLSVNDNTYYLTIRPDGTTMRTVSGTFGANTFATSLLGFYGTEGVTIDGRPNENATNGYLTFSNTGSTGAWVLGFAGAPNPRVQYVTIKGDRRSAGISPAVFVRGCDNLVFKNNKVMRTDIGVYLHGDDVNHNAIIENNTFGSNVVAEYLSRYAMTLSGVGNAQIPGVSVKYNTIYNVSSMNTKDIDIAGIYAGYNSAINYSTIAYNKVYSIKNNHPNGDLAIGIRLNNMTNTNVFNNVVYDVMNLGSTGTGTSLSAGPIGIAIGGSGANNKINYNSVNMYGAVEYTSLSSAMYWASTGTGVEFNNNNLVNSITGPAGTKSYSYYRASVPTFTTSDNNNFYVSGDYGVLGYTNSADRLNWAALQPTLAQNTNSISANPLFIANNNLAITNNTSPMIFAAAPLAAITDDYARNSRNANYPTIGAYEYNGLDIIPTPRLSYPADLVNPFMIGDTLKWTRVAEASQYSVQLSTTSDFSNPQLLTVDSIFVVTNATILNPTTQYYWRVQAIALSGVTSAWSRSRSFITSGALAVPQLLTPDNNSQVTIISNGAVTFTWTSVFGATSYDIQVSNSPNFTVLAYSANTANLTATGTFAPVTNYYWRVRSARNVPVGTEVVKQTSEWTNPEWVFRTSCITLVNPQSFDVWDASTLLPEGWTRLANGAATTNTNYFRSVASASYVLSPSSAVSPHSGAGLVEFYGNGIGSTNYGELVSPAINYSNRNGAPATFSFWMFRGNYSLRTPATALYVYLHKATSTTITAPIAPVFLERISARFDSIPVVAASGWYQYTYTIPAEFNDENTRIIFKVTSDYYNGLLLDDITWTSFPCNDAQELPIPLLLTPANEATAVSTNPTFTWREVSGANDYIYELSTIGDFSTLITTGNTSTMTFNAANLAGGVTHYWRVKAHNTESDIFSQWSATMQFTTVSYCLPRYQNACDEFFSEYITLVRLGSLATPIISNASACATDITGYSNYTAISGTVYLGQVVPITVNNSDGGIGVGDIVHTYFDWNQNGILDDEGEDFILTPNVDGSVYTANITIPATATLGNTIMRVRMFDNSEGTPIRPCDPALPVEDAPSMGEAEDYALRILPVIPTITVAQFQGAYCEGAALSVPYTISGSGSFAANNVFTAKLYDAQGTAVGNVGSLLGTTSGTITGTIPTVPANGNYRIKITSSNYPSVSANDNGTDLVISKSPNVYTFAIANTNLCLNTTANATLSNSQEGVNYQLYRNDVAYGTPIPGTGSAMNISLPTEAIGNYTFKLVGSNASCPINMIGTLAVVVNQTVATQTVTATNNGVFCSGSDGVQIGLAATQTGATYKLLLDGSPLTSRPAAVNGAAINFGYYTAVGTYTVLGYFTTGICETNMANSVVVSSAPVPDRFTLTAVGNNTYCDGGEGVELALDGSQTGVTYNLKKIGTQGYVATFPGTGAPMSLGLQTGGSYQVYASNGNCESVMFGTAVIVATPPAVPTLATPANGATDMVSPVVLTWNPVTSCMSGYKVQISTSETFTTPFEVNVTEPTYSYALGTNGTTYYWRVKSVNGQIEGAYCTARTFTMREGTILTIALAQGWNMISSNIVPINATLANIWNGNANMKYMRNNAGQIYVPTEIINTIGDWNVTQGYQVFMSQSGSVDMIGEYANVATTTIPVSQGWNMVAYLRQTGLAAQNALSSLGNTVVIAKNGKGEMYMPAFGINTFEAGTANAQMMIPGRGYQIFTTAAGTLNYNVTPLRISESTSSTEPRTRFLTVNDTRTGRNASLVFVSQSIADGTEIGVFNSRNELVGNGVMNNNRAAITLWGDNELTSKLDGATEGESLSIKSYNSATGIVSNVSVADVTDIATGNTTSALKFANNGVFVARGTQEAMSGVFSVSANPNPATESAEVSYTTTEDGSITIDVFDLNGNKVTRLYDGASKANHTMKLDADQIASGVYTIVLTQGDRTATALIVIAK